MDLHPNTQALAALIGTWRGRGHGAYPTIADFDYADEWVFSHSGKPFIGFVQRTRIGQEPRHTESGYLRVPSDGVLEIVAALPTGQAEAGTGSYRVEDGVLVLNTDATITNTPSAKVVERTVRQFRLHGDTLTIDMFMDAVQQGLTKHLSATLTRVTDGAA